MGVHLGNPLSIFRGYGLPRDQARSPVQLIAPRLPRRRPQPPTSSSSDRAVMISPRSRFFLFPPSLPNGSPRFSRYPFTFRLRHMLRYPVAVPHSISKASYIKFGSYGRLRLLGPHFIVSPRQHTRLRAKGIMKTHPKPSLAPQGTGHTSVFWEGSPDQVLDQGSPFRN